MRIRTPADLARLVKTSRQAQSRTQQDVADAAGITRQSVARIERGHSGVSFDTVILILDYLGIRLDGTSTAEVLTVARPASAQAAFHRLDPAIGEALRRRVGSSGAATEFQKSLDGLSDPATRAALRSAIDAGDPGSEEGGEG